MKLNIKSVKEILNLKINMQRRGILITILLLRDDSSKITLAKCRASFNITKTKEDLIWLHENNFIEWSGFKNAKKSIDDEKVEPDVIEIIDFMNNLYKRKFGHKTYRKKTLSLLKENSVDDIKKVISNRYVSWKDSTMMSKHLQPSTIFKPSHFIKYLDEANHTREGEAFVNASKIDLKDGDAITISIANELIESDTYNLKMFSTDGKGGKRGVAKNIVRYGKDIKKLIHVQDTNERHNGVREYLYFYNTKI